VGIDGGVSRKRRVAAWVLLVVAVVLTPATLATRWVNFEITSEERFVNTLGPLAEDPEVQQALADRVTQLIFANVDVDELAQDALPTEVDFLAAPIASGVETFTQEQTLRFFQSEQFAELWRDALGVAHQAADALLTGKDEGAVQVQDGEVVVDLSTIVQAVVDQLAERGLTFVESIPTDAISGQIVLFQSDALASAQSLVELLNTLSWALLVVGLVCYGASIMVLGDGRRGFVRSGVGLAVGALLLGVLLATGRGFYLDALQSAGADRTVQAIVFDQVVASLRNAIRVVIAAGAVIAVAAWLFGPSRPATFVRELAASGLGKGAAGADRLGVAGSAPVRWIARFERPIQVVVLVVVALVFLTWDQPTPGVVLLLAVVALVPLAVVSVVARAGRVGASPTSGGDGEPVEEEDAFVVDGPAVDEADGADGTDQDEAGAAPDADGAPGPADEGDAAT
jgi:hypothetical protein